jgi:hypothetical protein
MIRLKYSSVSPRSYVIDVCVLLLGMVVVLESVMMGLGVMLVLNLLVLFRVNASPTLLFKWEVHSRRHVRWRI